MSSIIAFEATFVPRIGDGGQAQAFREDCLRGQRAFWEAIQYDISELFHYVSFELRYVAHETTRRISIWFIVEASQLNSAQQIELAGKIHAILPKGYGWVRRSDFADEPDWIPQRMEHGGWVTCKAVRRLVFADIPEIRDVTLEEGRDEQKPAGIEGEFPRRAVNGEGRRQLLGFRDDPRIDAPHIDSGWAVPLIMPIQSTMTGSPRFFEQLQALAPAVVSVRLGRLEPNRLPPLRTMANHYINTTMKGVLESRIENAYGGSAASYHRYILPDNLFNLVDISLAATNHDDARDVCHLFCSQIGGLSGFRQADVTSQDTLLQFPNQVQIANFFSDPSISAMRQACLLEDLETFDVEVEDDDEILENFLFDAPYIYTFHELLAMVALPIADDRGLPGIDSRLLPPFNSPSLTYDPVIYAGGAVLSDSGAGSGRDGEIRIGMRGKVQLSGKGAVVSGPDAGSGIAHWHRISKADLSKHALVVGSTGSGKTMMTSLLVRELYRTNTPFCVIEPVKTEYYRKLNPLMPVRRFNFEGGSNGKRSQDFFSFDPFRLPVGVTVAKHASYTSAAWQAALPMDTLGSLLFANGLLSYYTKKSNSTCGFDLFQRGSRSTFRHIFSADDRSCAIFPSFWTFKVFFLKEYIPAAFATSAGNDKGNEFRENAINFFRRRFELIEGGLLGEALRGGQSRAMRALRDEREWPLRDDLDLLFEGNTVLELDAIPDNDEKALIMAFVFTRMFEVRQAETMYETDLPQDEKNMDGQTNLGGDLKHVLIIEEAHRLLSSTSANISRGEGGGTDPKSKAIGLFVDMLAEIRALGQGIVIVEQIPTKIIPEAVKNTNLKIMLRMPSREDRDVLGQAMNLTEEQIRFVATLRANSESGIDFVVFEEQLDQPILLNLPLPPRDDGRHVPGWLFDEFFAAPIAG